MSGELLNLLCDVLMDRKQKAGLNEQVSMRTNVDARAP